MRAPPSLCVVPGFADTSRSWQRLLASSLADRCRVEIVDLPGVGIQGHRGPHGFDAMVEHVMRQIASAARHSEVFVIGHSLGAAIAVAASERLEDRVAGLLSVEGNLTTDDGYFSATAAAHESARTFVDWLANRVDELVEHGEAPRSYLDSINGADPATLWNLGREAARRGADDAFGAAYCASRIPTRYLWSATSTPPRTQRFLVERSIDARRNDNSTHWPLERTPGWLLTEIDAFIDGDVP